MGKEKVKAFQQKILDGVALATQRMIEEKKKADASLAVFRDGKVQIIKARDIDTDHANL